MISTHILDTSLGTPAQGVTVELFKATNGTWQSLHVALTNADGRIVFDVPAEAGDYRLVFGIETYAAQWQMEPFFLDVPITFRIHNTQRKYHVPLLLNPYGFSTYRGS
ncbi:MAG: hydroxyisourate hydrolase [Acidobacteria bacterium]|nr:hydroxyisourate hydrolase [Acidobacteriota bacterium]MCB9399541.1 hydroxyisourate hydrolase [Acidobacteriota bacterium]